MTVLSIDMSDRETPPVWTGAQKTTHPIDPLVEWAIKGWNKASAMADEVDPDWDTIQKVQDAAIRLEHYAWCEMECTCNPRDSGNCPICQAIALIMNS